MEEQSADTVGPGPGAMSAVLYASGGSGGHLAPAIALAQEEIGQFGKRREVWVGTTKKVVDQRLQRGHPELSFRSFTSRPLVGGPLGAFQAFFQNLVGMMDAARFLNGRCVSRVMATGGFGCVPVLSAAILLGIPVLLHESNSVPGKVSRWFCCLSLRFYVTRLFQSNRLNGWRRTISVGFPLRKNFGPIDKREAKQKFGMDVDKPLVTVFGGSQGARSLTKAAERNSKQWVGKGYQVICVTGPGNYQPEFCVQDRGRINVIAFVDDMAALLSATDVLIARSGAGSIAEIAKIGCPSILVPLPGSADDHQQMNAAVFASAGCAEILDQDRLDLLEEKVDKVLDDAQFRREMIDSLNEWSSENSVSKVVNELRESRLELAV